MLVEILHKKRVLPRSVALWFCLLPFIVLLAPAVAVLVELWSDNWTQALASTLASATLMLLPAALCMTVRGYLLLLLPVAPMAAVFAVYPTVFHQLPGQEAWFALFQTNAVESYELATYFWQPVATIVLATGLYAGIAFAIPHITISATLRKISLATILGLSPILLQANPSNVFPAGPLYQVWQALGTSPNPTVAAELPSFVREPRPPDREIFVFLIGESARRHEFYELLPRTPSLLSRPNLVLYDAAISQAGMTQFSVPLMLSGFASSVDEARPNALAIARAAGLRVVWLNHNDAEAKFAQGADELIHVHRGRDLDLLPIIQRQLDVHRKLFLVVHTSGSHAPYTNRYAPHEEIFAVESGTGKSALRAAYGNSIAATHRFLDAVLSLLSNQDGHIFLWYASDHGENLLDDERGLRMHGFGARIEYDVPLLFWANDAYVRAHPSGWAQLTANRYMAVSTGDLLATFKQALGVVSDSDNGLMRPYRPYVRRVRFNSVILPYSSLY